MFHLERVVKEEKEFKRVMLKEEMKGGGKSVYDQLSQLLVRLLVKPGEVQVESNDYETIFKANKKYQEGLL